MNQNYAPNPNQGNTTTTGSTGPMQNQNQFQGQTYNGNQNHADSQQVGVNQRTQPYSQGMWGSMKSKFSRQPQQQPQQQQLGTM